MPEGSDLAKAVWGAGSSCCHGFKVGRVGVNETAKCWEKRSPRCILKQ